jgi:hypothetical protein
MSKRKHTPGELDYLFARHVIDEDDYAAFWKEYWKASEARRKEIVNEYVQIAAEGSQQPLASVVTRSKSNAAKQAQQLSATTDRAYRVVRRNAKGQFSKRGTYWQTIKKVTKKK